MATIELYRRSSIVNSLTDTLDYMVSSGKLAPELAIQVLIQFDKSMKEAMKSKVNSKLSIKGHLHTYRFCDDVWTFILADAQFKSQEISETISKVKIVHAIPNCSSLNRRRRSFPAGCSVPIPFLFKHVMLDLAPPNHTLVT